MLHYRELSRSVSVAFADKRRRKRPGGGKTAQTIFGVRCREKALSRRQAQEENPDGFLFERNDPLGSRSPRQKQSPEPLDTLAHRRRNLAVAERAHAAGGGTRYGFRMARQVHFPLAGRNRKRRYPQEVRNDRHAGMGIQMSQVREIPAVQMVEHRMGQKLPRRRRPNGLCESPFLRPTCLRILQARNCRFRRQQKAAQFLGEVRSAKSERADYEGGVPLEFAGVDVVGRACRNVPSRKGIVQARRHGGLEKLLSKTSRSSVGRLGRGFYLGHFAVGLPDGRRLGIGGRRRRTKTKTA